MRGLLFSVLAWVLCLSAQAGNYVYILTGQSNSLGAVKGTPATPEMLQRYASEGLLWNGNMVRDTGECFEKNPSWQVVAPQLPTYGNLCMGPEYGFSYMMHRRGWHTKKGDKLYIIKASLDGGGNSFWLPNGAAWKSLTSSLKTALSRVPADAHVQALLYLQGESDKAEEISRASERFADLRTRMKKEAKKGPFHYAVVGECATWDGRETKDAKGNTSAGVMYAMTRKKKDVGWVRTRDLSKITSGDQMGVHYDGKSQITIGARYAYAVAVLEKLPLGSVRGDAPDASVDTPAAWWGGKVPGEADVAVWDVSSANAEDVLRKDMSVAGVRVEDPFRDEVVLAPGNKKKAVLRLGAKGIALEGASLAVKCGVHTAADQVWHVTTGHNLSLGTPEAPVELSGSGRITLSGAAGASVVLHLQSAPEQEWLLGSEAPRVSATIGGKPAQLEKQGSGYKLLPVPPGK